MRHLMVLVLLAAFAVTDLVAQEEGSKKLQGGLLSLHGILTYPRSAFAEKYDHVGLGGGLDLGWAPTTLPVVAGFSGNFSYFSSTTMHVPVVLSGSRTTVDVDAVSKLATLNLFARLQPHTGAFRPFIEGLLGLFILWADFSVDERYENSGLRGESVLSDASFGYGAGGGMEFRVYTGTEGNTGGPAEAYISARVRYLYGGEMEYLHEETITFDSKGEPHVLPENVMKSDIEMMQVLIGITARL